MRFLLRLLVVGGLAVDAGIHLYLASDLDGVKDGGLSEGALFRIQAAVAIVSAVLVLFWPRRWTYAFAFLVAASAVGALVLYRYVDVGSIGPIPGMYEPIWYWEKNTTLIAEAVAAGAAVLGFFFDGGRSRVTDRR